MDIETLKGWIGRSATAEEKIQAFPANAFAATLDRDDPEYVTGSALPPLWHWLHFINVFKLSEAGYDGHAALGGFLPPVPLPRRMWAGSRLRFLAPMHIGRVLTRNSTVTSVEGKQGRGGDLVFVTVKHQVFDGTVECLVEEHDIVYRTKPDPGDPPPKLRTAPADSAFSREIHPDPVLLFRYSALTFNGHRIHYDRPFCTETEGYEGLVAHGPLLASFLLDLLRRQRPEAQVRTFEFRALAPVFDTHSFSVHGSPGDDSSTFRLWVRRHDGTLAMDAKTEVAGSSK